MDRRRRSRKWLPALCLLTVTGCGGESSEPAGKAAAAPSPDAAFVKRCTVSTIEGDGGFPAGLLPPGAAIIADGRAIAPGELTDVYTALQERAGDAGMAVRDTELETFDAEIELAGPDGEFGLRLSVPRACARATDVRLAG